MRDPRMWQILAGGLVSLALAGCGSGGGSDAGGGGGGGGGGSAGDPLRQLASFEGDDVAHLLTRTAFAADPEVTATIASGDVVAAVDAMLELPDPRTTPWAIDAARLLVNPSDPPGLEGRFPSERQLAQWWLSLMVHSEHPFQEAVALFWHDHFAVSSEVLDGSRRHWMVEHVHTLRAQGTGNFRDLLLAMSRDAVMLKWLDGVRNTQVDPNENYAREFFELFSLGVDNGYTEHDIREAARVFTGYRERFDATTGLSRVEFDPTRHDFGAKVVLDAIIQNGSGGAGEDYAVMVDLLLQQRPVQVSEFVARKAAEWFGFETAPDAVVQGLGRTLREANWELKPMFRQLFLSEAFHDPALRGSMVKSPLDFAIGFIRQTRLEPEIDDLERAMDDLAMRPTDAPGVEGWPGGELWLSAQGMVERANLLRLCIWQRQHQRDLGIDVAHLLPTPDATAEAVVDHVAGLLGIELSGDDRTELVTYLGTERTWQGVDQPSAFDPSVERHREERLRGLLYVLGQHPSFTFR